MTALTEICNAIDVMPAHEFTMILLIVTFAIFMFGSRR